MQLNRTLITGKNEKDRPTGKTERGQRDAGKQQKISIFKVFIALQHFYGNVKINLTESSKGYGSITKESGLFAHSRQKKMNISR